MSETLTISARLARLDQFVADQRVIRGKWADQDAEGRERACLLAALAPECAAALDSGACPADLMPDWLAELTPWMDDHGTAEAWPAMIQRYAALAHRWITLDAAAWERVRIGWLADDVIPMASSHVTADEWGVREACERVRCALRGDGDLATMASEVLGAASMTRGELGLPARWAARAAWSATKRSFAAEAAVWAVCGSADGVNHDVTRLTDALLTRIEAECAALKT